VVISRLLKFIRRQLRSGERFKSIAEGASVQNKLVQTTACCTLVSHTNNYCRPRAKRERNSTLRCPAPWRAASPRAIQTMLSASTILRRAFSVITKISNTRSGCCCCCGAQMCRRLLRRCARELAWEIGGGRNSAGGGRSHDPQLARPGNPGR
jgi:hypothetical protein